MAKKPFNGLPIDYSPKKVKVEELSVPLSPCCNCGKEIEKGYYSRHGNGGTCSRPCMIEQDKKPKYPGHTEEDYFRNLGEPFLQQLEIKDGLNDFSADA